MTRKIRVKLELNKKKFVLKIQCKYGDPHAQGRTDGKYKALISYQTLFSLLTFFRGLTRWNR